MEGSTSKTPPDSEANGSNGDKGWEDIIISFGSFGLGKDGTLISLPSMIQSENAVSFSSSDNSLDVKEDVTNDTDKLSVTQVNTEEEGYSSQGIEIDELPDSIDTEWPPMSSVLQENIWAQPNLYNGRGSNTNYTDNDLNRVPANSNRSLRVQTYASSIYEDSSFQNPAASLWNYQSDVYHSGNHMVNGSGNFSSVMGSQFNYDPLSQIRSGGYYMNNNIASSTLFPYQDVMEFEVPQNSSLQQEINFLLVARTRCGSEWLQKVLELGKYESTQAILNGVLGSIFQLMIDDNGHHVFGKLVEKCQSNQLGSIVSKAHSEPDTFTDIAFIYKGSRSIQRLIERLKKSPMVQIITSILSRRSYELLTHKIGSHVIRLCFFILGEKSNLEIYGAISNRLLDLATDPVGCISLNNCVNSITGPIRILFLEYLAVHSLFLSNDASGNFVVQHMLNLNNEDVTGMILYCLQGNFEQLAQKQGGSHVVQKCMRSSRLGLRLVVTEILKDEKALFRLAGDLFGNYVIQTALKETKISNQSLYQELLKALKPYYSYLMGKTRGRHAAELIREDLGLQKAKSLISERPMLEWKF